MSTVEVKDKTKIVDLLYSDEIWERTYETFLNKWTVSLDELSELSAICTIKREGIISKLLDGSYEWGIPEKLELSKAGTKKKRVVYMFDLERRFVLGVLYRVLGDYFNSDLAENCFAYRKGVSVQTAINYLREDNKIYNMYGVKVDISAYFNSLKRDFVIDSLNELFEDGGFMHENLSNLYSIDQVYKKGKLINEDMGLIPGTAVASFFANYVLKGMDFHFLEDEEVVYARYSDDMLLFAKDEEIMKIKLNEMIQVLDSYGLSVNPRKFEYYNPGDPIEFLGMEFTKDYVDINKNSKNKLKKRIRKSVKWGRKQIEMNKKDKGVIARRVIHRFNHRVYKCYIEDKSQFGWGYYAFRLVTRDDTLREIDFYTRDRLRFLFTGKNNSANIRKAPDDLLREHGYVSMTQMYHLFRTDFDLYCNEVSLLD